MALCRPACQEMQSNAFSCGLPLPQPGQPFYFVEVSEVPVPSGAPLSALPPRALYSRVSQVCCPQTHLAAVAGSGRLAGCLLEALITELCGRGQHFLFTSSLNAWILQPSPLTLPCQQKISILLVRNKPGRARELCS